MLMIVIYFNTDTLSQNWIFRREYVIHTTRNKMKQSPSREKKWNILNEKKYIYCWWNHFFFPPINVLLSIGKLSRVKTRDQFFRDDKQLSKRWCDPFGTCTRSFCSVIECKQESPRERESEFMNKNKKKTHWWIKRTVLPFLDQEFVAVDRLRLLNCVRHS